MITRRNLLKASIACLGSPILSGILPVHGDAQSLGTRADQPVAQADSLAEFISVQTHLNWGRTVWGKAPWRPLLGDLGVRYTRSALGNKAARDHMAALHEQYGIRSIAVVNEVNQDGSFDAEKTSKVLGLIRDKIGTDKVYAIEGPNEYTRKHKSDGWAERLSDYQAFVHQAIRSDPELRTLELLAPTVWKREVAAYEELARARPHADNGNLHLYNGGRRPSLFERNGAEQPVDLAINDAQMVVPGKPIFVTETGFNIAVGAPPTMWKIPPEVAAKYTLRIVSELFLRRDLVKRVNLYSLIDDEHRNQHHGLLSADLSPRPAYFALRNFMRLVSDPGPAFTPGALPYRILTDNPAIRSVLLQKRNRRFLLLIWQEVDSYDRSAGVAKAVPPSKVHVEFGRSVGSVVVYAPTVSDAAVQELRVASVATLDVPDHVLVAEVAD